MSQSSRGSATFEVSSGTVRLHRDGPLITLFLDEVESSCINTADPTSLEFEYMQHATCALDAVIDQGPIRALHLGGAACALPLAWAHARPKSRQSAVEIDADLAHGVRDWFDLPKAPELSIRVGDGRAVLAATRPATFDVIVRDAFDHGAVPAHMATRECARLARERLRPGGIYILNCAHGGGSDARREIATVREQFDEVVSIQDPKVGRSGRRGNVLLVALRSAGVPLPVDDLDRALRRLPLPARVTRGRDLVTWCAGAKPLTDGEAGVAGAEATRTESSGGQS